LGGLGGARVQADAIRGNIHAWPPSNPDTAPARARRRRRWRAAADWCRRAGLRPILPDQRLIPPDGHWPWAGEGTPSHHGPGKAKAWAVSDGEESAEGVWRDSSAADGGRPTARRRHHNSRSSSSSAPLARGSAAGPAEPLHVPGPTDADAAAAGLGLPVAFGRHRLR
jgi:hypothetical protein